MTQAHNAYSFTQLDDFANCPKFYELRHIWNIQRKKKDVNLRQGTVIHRLLMAHNLQQHIVTEADAILAEIDGNPLLFEDEKEEERAVLDDSFRIVSGYLDYYAESLAREEILHVEESFTVLLDSGEVVSCTPDLVFRRQDGSVGVRDYKSTQQAPSYTTPSSNLQVIMNFAAVRALYPEATTFEFDRLRKKVPTEPRLNKTGPRKVNNLKAVDTTYEALLDFLQTEAPDLLDDVEHRMRLAELRDENRFYYRETIIPTDEMIRNGLDDVAARVAMLEVSEERNLFPRTYKATGMTACERCSMQRVCQGQLLGWDTDRIIAEDYEERDTSYREYETEEI